MDENSTAGVFDEPAKKTILLIEDDPLLVKMYREKFEMEGFRVISAEDGEKGLDAAFNEKVDIVILDLLIPRLSGMDFLKKLRESEMSKDLPVIVLSNLSEREEQDKARQLGVKEYLLKANLTPTQVVEKIKLYV